MMNEIGINLMLTKEDVDDIVCTALEGGITYWCKKCEVIGEYLGEYASDQISRGGELKLYDRETNECYILDKKKLLKGVVIAGLKGYYKNYAWFDMGDSIIVDTCMVDAEVADVIIQCALFEEVIYG